MRRSRSVRRIMMSGGSIFDALDYSFTPGHEDGTDTAPNGPGGGSPALRQQVHILSDFLQALPLVHMRPDSATVLHASGAVARGLSWLYLQRNNSHRSTSSGHPAPPIGAFRNVHEIRTLWQF